MSLMYALAFLSVFLLLLGVRKRKQERHWTAYRRPREDVKPEKTEDLVVAGVTSSVGQNAVVGLIGAVAGAGAVYVVTGKLTFSVVGILAGVFVPRVWTSWKISGRRKLFEAQLESVLNHMGAALRAGANTLQAWEQGAQAAPFPAKDVLEYVVRLSRSGHSLSDALEKTGAQVDSRDLRVIAAATALCVQTGGDLAAVYGGLAETIRDRQSFKAQLDANMAEGKLSANALAMIPFGFIAMFRSLSPEYMSPLFDTARGVVVLLFCAGMIVGGWLALRKMMQVDY